jgi:Bacterial protein of unknown function (HtrL_YibB)
MKIDIWSIEPQYHITQSTYKMKLHHHSIAVYMIQLVCVILLLNSYLSHAIAISVERNAPNALHPTHSPLSQEAGLTDHDAAPEEMSSSDMSTQQITQQSSESHTKTNSLPNMSMTHLSNSESKTSNAWLNSKDILDTTLVSCYYSFPSKHPTSDYERWMKNYLSIERPMVIFVDESSQGIIEKYRPMYLANLTRIVVHPLESTLMHRLHWYWSADRQRDPEGARHNANLYMVWNQKTQFVRLAIENRTQQFNSDYFFWYDIGAFRHEEFMDRYQTHWPNKQALHRFDKAIALVQLAPFTQDECVIRPNENFTNVFLHANRIVGGTFGGHYRAVLRFWDAFYGVLRMFIVNQQFAGKDQSIMATAAIWYPHVVQLVQPIHVHELLPFAESEWFYLAEFLRKPDIPFGQVQDCIAFRQQAGLPPIKLPTDIGAHIEKKQQQQQ